QQAGAKSTPTPGASGGSSMPDVSVIPDDRTNSLVITAPPKLMRSMENVLAKLDIRRAQVLVQAIEAELTTDKSAELGVTWVADALNSGAVGLTDFSNTGTGIAGLAQSAAAASLASSSGVTGTTGISVPQGLTLGVGKIVNGGFSFAALLRALSGDSNTNILSTPSITTQDNQEADIKVAQQVPFVTGQYTNTTSGTTGGNAASINPFQTVTRQDVGLELKLTPQINQGDSIQLQIDAVVSNLTGASVGGQPVTNTREIKTNVMARDREIVVLGGLIDRNLIESEQRVPVLGSIPLLGNLFRYRSTQNTKSNLMVFIQPTILRDSETTSHYTNQQYDALRKLQIQNQGAVQLMPGEQRPVLDELKQPATNQPTQVPSANTVAPPAKTTTVPPAATTPNKPPADTRQPASRNGL
ncbi:MAG: type II secretion system protein GspD, partial [Gammaproteobacteria bacterium]